MKKRKLRTRKPRIFKNPTFPQIEVEDGRIWIRSKANAHWVKIPKKRARYVANRLLRAVDYVEGQ